MVLRLNLLAITSRDHEHVQRHFEEYNLIIAFTNRWPTTNDYVDQQGDKPRVDVDVAEYDSYYFLYLAAPR